MFIDLNAGETGTLVEADICIVGAGPAGISLALEFLGTDTSVLLLESGSLEFDAETQALNQGEVSGLEYPLAYSRQRFFGGTTNHWAGQSCPLEPIDFQQRAWVPHSGWPISYEEYARYIERAQRLCKLGDIPFAWDAWREHLDFPLPEETFEPVVLRFPDPVVYFGQEYREDIASAANIRCLTNATATNIEVDPEGRVEHIEVKSLGGKSARVKAGRFILACGAIQSIKLLLNSRNQVAQGLGNENGLVGKFFMEHPNYDTGLIELPDAQRYPMLTKPGGEVQGLKTRADFRLDESLQAELKTLNHTLFLVPAWNKPFDDDLGGQVAEFWHKVEGKINRYLGTESRMLKVRLEHAPSERSHVGLSDEKDALGLNNVDLHFEIGELETHTIAVVQEQLARALGAKNIGRMKIDFEPGETEWKTRVGWQYHHLGGTRMSARAETGVVDGNCRMHSVDNLYIASSSVFPTGGHANPTMNIIAFALRLADHLKQEMALT